MGIFSDTCTECGAKVKKAARFCSKCGNGAPDGWWKCPGCSKWVGNESQFCWSCKTALHPESRDSLAGGVWQKGSNVFAERLEVGDLRILLKDGLSVQEGTAAILLQGGAYRDVLKPGRHTLESLAHKINHWGNAPLRTVILVDNGDVVVPLRLTELRTAEDIPVQFYSEVLFHFDAKNAAEFVANLVRDSKVVEYVDLTELLLGEIRHAVINICNTSTIEDLLKDPNRRLQLEDELQRSLKERLVRCGLEIVRVASVEFTGAEYERLRAQYGEVDLKRRELEARQRLREVVTKERLDEARSAQDVEDYIRQLGHEKGLSEQARAHELEMLRQLNYRELSREQFATQLEAEEKQLHHELEQEAARHVQALQLFLDQARAEAQASGIAADEQMRQTTGWLDIKAQKNKVRNAAQRERLDMVKGIDIMALVATEDDPAKRADLLKLAQQQQQTGQSSEQILAAAAVSNPAAAAALGELLARQNRDKDNELRSRAELLDQNADRLERIMSKGLDASSKSGDTPAINVIK